jgi:hypothetical protein
MWRNVALFSLLAASLCKPDKFSGIRNTCLALDDLVGWAKAHHYLLIVDFLFSIRVAQGIKYLAFQLRIYLSKIRF